MTVHPYSADAPATGSDTCPPRPVRPGAPNRRSRSARPRAETTGGSSPSGGPRRVTRQPPAAQYRARPGAEQPAGEDARVPFRTAARPRPVTTDQPDTVPDDHPLGPRHAHSRTVVAVSDPAVRGSGRRGRGGAAGRRRPGAGTRRVRGAVGRTPARPWAVHSPHRQRPVIRPDLSAMPGLGRISCETVWSWLLGCETKTTMRPARSTCAGRGRRCQGPLPGLR